MNSGLLVPAVAASQDRFAVKNGGNGKYVTAEQSSQTLIQVELLFEVSHPSNCPIRAKTSSFAGTGIPAPAHSGL